MSNEAEGAYEKLFGKPRLSDDLARELGHVTAQWGLIETSLNFTICVLLNHIDKVGTALTAELSMLQRLTLIESLIECTGKPEWQDLWSGITKSFDRARNLRNEVVHGLWMINESGASVTRMKAKGRAVHQNRIWTIEELKKLTELETLIADAVFRFCVLMMMEGVPKALINPPPEPSEPRNRVPSRATQLQARAQKKVKKDADRALSRTQKKPTAS